MPSHDFSNIGDVLDFDILRGTITAVDSATDTCTVSVGGDSLEALLFYHCEPDSILRDNGAIEGAAAGFAADDEVIVMVRKDREVVKVIAHIDGVRHCKSLSIYFGAVGTDSGAGDDCWCFVWDVETDDYKEDVPLNREDDEAPIAYASFPCKMSEISDWLSEQSFPDTYGNIFNSSSTKGTVSYPSLDIDWYGNDSDSASVPALVGEGTNTASGVASTSRSNVITPFVGEEWHNSNIQEVNYNITDAYGQNGLLYYWPMAWSQRFLISDYFNDGGSPALFLTSCISSSEAVITNDGYYGFYDHSGDYSEHREITNGSTTLTWTSPFGDSFTCSMSSSYSKLQVAGAEEAISGYGERIPERFIYGGAPTYLQYRNLLGITGSYTKTLMAYLVIALFKVMHADSVSGEFTETIYRKVFAGFKKCEDTSEESPLDIERNSAFEDAIIDVLIKQAADIDTSGIPASEGQQIADRSWNYVIFGGKNN